MTDRSTVFFLHGLGCSAKTWNGVLVELADSFDCVALDLPGHGDNSESDALTVEQMADWVIETVVDHHPSRWALVGHSMGGKIATIVAARAEAGVPGMVRPFALALVAASPLSPEPMDEATRAQMISWCADGSISTTDAETYLDANTADPLAEPSRSAAIQDVRRVHPVAWMAWLERGSREDWSHEVTRVRTPALVVAGGEDGELGPANQRRLVLPYVAASAVAVVPSAAHLIMLERPAELAGRLRVHFDAALAQTDVLPARAAELIMSDRVSARTRSVLLQRTRRPSGRVFTDRQRHVLEALLARVVPQRETQIDLANRIENNLSSGESDGWRFAELPPDEAAWRRGLDTLELASGGFVHLDDNSQDSWLERVVAGEVGFVDTQLLTAEQMTLWFEDVRAEAVRAWVSHPTTMARIGYDGFANGGDGLRKQGYLRVGAGESETWQQELRTSGAQFGPEETS